MQPRTYALVCILTNLSCHHGNGTIKFLPNLVPVCWCLSSWVEGYLQQLVGVLVAYLLVRHAEQTTCVIIGLMNGDATVWRRNGLVSLQASRTGAKAAPVGEPFFRVATWLLMQTSLTKRAAWLFVGFLLLYFITASTGSPKKSILGKRWRVPANSQSIFHTDVRWVYTSFVSAHIDTNTDQIFRRKFICRKPISYRHRSKGHASYSTDLQYRAAWDSM